MNRYQLMQMQDGVKEQLKVENKKLEDMYMDSSSTKESRAEQQKIVADLEERFNGIKAKIEALDEAAKKQLEQNNKLNNTFKDEKAKKIHAKAELIRATMRNKTIDNEVLNILGDGSSLGNGEKILPTTMVNELLHEPFVKNPLRDISVVTSITNLEIPKINFSLDDDSFTNDTETGKELEADNDLIEFGRNRFKVFCDVSETILNGTDTNLVETIDNALESGLAKKEKKVVFEASTPTEASFYYKKDSNYVIKQVTGATMFEAIITALGDLEDDYSDNAHVVMKKSDYFKMIKELANGNAALFLAPPEQILGAPVVYCDLATIPIVGDFRYSHFNYDINMIFDRDKDVKTGIESFVLTAWLDHKIKMKSAFRLAVVTP